MKKAKPQKGKGNWLVLPDGITYQNETVAAKRLPQKSKKRLRPWCWVVLGCIEYVWFLQIVCQVLDR